MKRYQVMLSTELAELYEGLSEQAGMSVEQTLSSVLQLYAESLTQRAFESICNAGRLRSIEESYKRKENRQI